MPLKTLIAPIAAATIVNVMLFALAWRGHQAERREGRAPWWLGAGATAYALALAAYVHFRGEQPITGGGLFVGALTGEAAGAVIVYALLWGFLFTRGRPWTERAWPIACGLILTGGMIAATLAV